MSLKQKQEDDSERGVLSVKYTADIFERYEVLACTIKDNAEKLGKNVINYIPSHFLYVDIEEVVVIPQCQYPTWESIRKSLKEFASMSSGGVLVVVPNVWQVFYSIQPAIRENDLFSVGETIKNIPLCAYIVEHMKVNIVITYPDAAFLLARELEKNKATSKLNLLIIIGDSKMLLKRDIKKELKLMLPGTVILLELQILPGHTVAYQSVSMHQSPNRFHLKSTFRWEYNCQGGACVTAISPEELPFFRMPIQVEYVLDKDNGGIDDIYKLEYGGF